MLLVLVGSGAGPAGRAVPPPAGTAGVVIETSVGTIHVVVDTVRAPLTAKNFLRYVDGRFYDGGAFVRTVRGDNQAGDPVRIAVVQAMDDPARHAAEYPPIPLERTTVTGLRHHDGTLSMARNVPNSARSSFFICIGDQPDLDYAGHRNPDGQGFAAFGRVTSGMSVVRQIWSAHANGQQLVPPIRIVRVAREGTAVGAGGKG